MKNLVAKTLIITALAGFASVGNALEVTVEGGLIEGNTTVGTSIKKGKYTVDGHVGVGNETTKVKSLGIYRDIFKLDNITIGAGLSASEVEEQKGRLIKTRTWQGYDLQLDYKINDYKIRGTVNSNGDLKLGVGFSF